MEPKRDLNGQYPGESMAYSLRSILKGSTVFTAGQVLARATGFFLIPIYTRFLTPEDYGIIGVLNVVVVIMTALLSLGMSQAQTRYYYEYHGDRQRVGELLYSINVLLFLVVFGVCAILTVFGKPLFEPLVQSDAIYFYPFVVLTIWTVFFNVFNQIVPNYYVATKRYMYCAVLLFLQFLLSVGFIILFVVFFREGALGSIKGTLIGYALFFVLFYWKYAANFVRRLKADVVRKTLAMGLPVMVHTTAAAAMASVDRLILNEYLVLSSVGIYTLGYRFGLVMSIIVTSINRAWMPNYYELMNQQDADRSGEIRRIFAIWITAIGAVCIMGSLWSRSMIELLTTPEYFEAASVVPLILLGYFFQGVYFFMSGPIFYFKKTILLPAITVASALTNVGLNVWLIPKIGIMGSAWATTLSFFALAVLAYYCGRRYFDPRFELGRLSLLILIVAGLCVATPLIDRYLLVKFVALGAYVSLCFVFFPRYWNPLLRRVVAHVRRKA